METNNKTNNELKPSQAPPAQKSNKTIFWILGGCLVLLLIGALVIAGLAWWGYKKVKNEAQKSQQGLEMMQNQAEKMAAEAEKYSLPQNQNIPEDPAVASGTAIVPDTGVPDDIYPPSASEKAVGYLKKIYTKNGKNYIDIDYVQWLTGDTAEKAMREDGMCPKSGECIVYNDYYIRNQNPLIRTFEVAPEAEIRAHEFEAEYASGNWNESMTFSRFSQYFNKNSDNGYWDSAPFHVEIGNNKILKITEQYIP